MEKRNMTNDQFGKKPVVKAFDIQWDVDAPEDLEDLPTEIAIPEKIADDEDAISDYLSDVTGFCHTGFQLTSDSREENK